MTAAQARFDRAFAAHDIDKLQELMAEGYDEIDHPSGSRYGRAGSVASLGFLLGSHDATYRVEPLATLGETVDLCRRRLRASAATEKEFDLAEFEIDAIDVRQVDERGRFTRLEAFAPDRLSDAVVRLYELYAERCPTARRATVPPRRRKRLQRP